MAGWSDRKASSAQLVDSHLHSSIVPFFHRDRLGDVRASEMLAFVKHLEANLAPSACHTVHALARAMFRQAVDDNLIAASLCVRIPVPKLLKADVIPLSTR